MRAAIIALLLVLAPSLAHAGTKAKVLKLAIKAGWSVPTVVQKGTVWAVHAEDPDGNLHLLLVDPARKQVADAGDGTAQNGKVTIKVRRFLGKKALVEVIVRADDSNALGRRVRARHYVLRKVGFELACWFDGEYVDTVEGGHTNEKPKVTKTADRPLEWDVGSYHYKLGATGTCEGQL